MSPVVLPRALIEEVSADAITEMAKTFDSKSRHYLATAWQSEKSDTVGLDYSDGSSRFGSRATIVHGFIAEVYRHAKIHPADILRDLLGRPVSIPAQGWRVPRQCDYGRKDVLEAHRFPGVTEWVVYSSNEGGVSRASKDGEVMIHDIAELPT